MAFRFPPRFRLAQIPTPIQKMERLSRYLEGPTLFIKRDDLTGIGLSGNKIRKLEFVLAEALRKKCDTVITCGGLGSNHARATAVAARQLGLTPVLVLRGNPGPVPDGNFFLDALLNAEIRLITAEQYKHHDEIMEQVADELRQQGRNPFVIPEGASDTLGCWGYFHAAKEIEQQIKRMNLSNLDGIVVPVGSGGTIAGLVLGCAQFGLDVPIYGFNVLESAEIFTQRVSRLIREFHDRYPKTSSASEGRFEIIDGYVGAGYALSRQEELELIKLVARLEGIFLDPVYTGKAMFGLIDQIRRGRFSGDANLLFIHTGGIFGLFPKRKVFVGEPDTGEFSEGK